MAHKFKIENSTPVPRRNIHNFRGRRKAGGLLEAFRSLEKGQCIFMPTHAGQDLTKVQVKLCNYAHRVKREAKDREFTSRRMPDGIRIWRVK